MKKGYIQNSQIEQKLLSANRLKTQSLNQNQNKNKNVTNRSSIDFKDVKDVFGKQKTTRNS